MDSSNFPVGEKGRRKFSLAINEAMLGIMGSAWIKDLKDQGCTKEGN